MFSLRTTRGTLSLLLVDVLISYLPLSLVLPHLPEAPGWMTLDSFKGNALLLSFVAVMIGFISLTRLYSFFSYNCRPTELLGGVLPAFLLSLLTLSSFCHLAGFSLWLRWHLVLPLGETFLGLFIIRYFVFYGMEENRERLLILGATEQARQVIEKAKERGYRGFEIIGLVSNRDFSVGADFHGRKVLGHMDRLGEIVTTYNIDSIVVTLRERRGHLPVHELLAFKLSEMRIYEGHEFYEKVLRKMMIDEYFKPSSIIFEKGFILNPVHKSIKRAQGLLVSAVLLALFSPLFLLIAVLIKLNSPGPVLYRQGRVGQHGHVFELLKFRSMVKDAEKLEQPVFTQENDPRVTRVGRVLRKLRLDEVPQFINIFKGDMDLVGPRPERPYFVEQLQERIPYYGLRHSVRPGITGWAQIMYPYGDTLESGEEKLKYDLYYLKHYSWYLDSVIIFLTIKEVLYAKGR